VVLPKSVNGSIHVSMVPKKCAWYQKSVHGTIHVSMGYQRWYQKVSMLQKVSMVLKECQWYYRSAKGTTEMSELYQKRVNGAKIMLMVAN
jgi:hypothetical protein